MELVANLPMMLDQIVDSCYSLVLFGLREAPVTAVVPSSVRSRQLNCVSHCAASFRKCREE